MQSKDWTNWCWYRLRLIWLKLSFKLWTTRSTLTSRCSSLDKSFRFSFKYSTTSAVSRDWLTDWRQRVSEELRSRFESSTFAGSRGSALRCYHLVRTKHTFSPVVCLNLSFHSWDKWIFKFENKNWDVNIFRESGLSTISNLPDPNPFHQSWYQNTNKNQTPKKSSKHKIRRFLVRSCRLITQKSQNTIIVWIKMP